jgi:putative ABC transport system substrate-binding protein
MRRRNFLGVLGSAAAAWPVVARAQPTTKPVVGILIAEARDMQTPRFRSIHDGLNETGFAEGRNVAIEVKS